MSAQGYDVIGDIHGHADTLRRLLIELNYSEHRGIFGREDRKAIFLGDLIDRGPDQKEVLRIARCMCEAGTAMAVLGNHEFNAVAWAMTDDNGGFLRAHSEKNRHQHAEFLRQLNEGSSDYWAAIDWFKSLPVWLDFRAFRVVHACWHEPSMWVLQDCIDENQRFTKEGLRKALQQGSEVHAATEILLKGPEQPLPIGVFYSDKDGRERQEVRIRWWDANATTFRKAAIGVDDKLNELPDFELPTDFRYFGSAPVFFGHYWMDGEPTLTSGNAACLDFSIATHGCLTAYRWSGERELLSSNLVHVRAQSHFAPISCCGTRRAANS